MPGEGRQIDLGGRIVLPPSSIPMSHLDKAYIVRRTGIPAGGLLDAVKLSGADAVNWTAADLHARDVKGAGARLPARLARACAPISTRRPCPMRTGRMAGSSMRCAGSGRAASRCRPSRLMSIERVDEADDYVERCPPAQGHEWRARCVHRTPAPRRLNASMPCSGPPGDAGLDVDFHVDETLDPSAQALELICGQHAADGIFQAQVGWKGRVIAVRCSTMPNLGPRPHHRQGGGDGRACRLASLGTNLFLQDRVTGRHARSARHSRLCPGTAGGGRLDPLRLRQRPGPVLPFRGLRHGRGVPLRPCALPISTREIGAWLVRQFRSASEACGVLATPGVLRDGRGRGRDLVIFDVNDLLDLMSVSPCDRVWFALSRGAARRAPLSLPNLRRSFRGWELP